MLKNREAEGIKELFELGFGKRFAEELYDLSKDPFQMTNVAYSERYEEVRVLLSGKLTDYLKAQGDPSEASQRELNLEEEYSYIDEL